MLLYIFLVITKLLTVQCQVLNNETAKEVVILEASSDCPCMLKFSEEIFYWDCDSSGLTQVPLKCWTETEHYPVSQVILSNNFITEIFTDDFMGLNASSLDTLMLSHNNITAVHLGAFNHLTSLKTLDLYSNLIGHLNDDVFDGLVNLETLWVGHNSLGSIPDISFITKATAISFSQNQISSFSEKLLENPTRPIILSLQQNLATEIQSSALLNLPDYSTLNLDNVIIWAASEEEADVLRAKTWFGTEVDGLIQVASNATNGTSECPDHFHDVGGVCLLVQPFFEGDWSTMRFFCHEMESEMLAIRDANFYWLLLRFLREQGLDGHGYWLGASDIESEGDWRWIDGTQVEQGSPFWATLPQAPGEFAMEPLGGSSENCLSLDKSRFLYFDDSDCARSNAVICQL